MFLTTKSSNMKKIFVLATLLSLAFCVQAQDDGRTTVSIGINAGIPTSSPGMYSVVLGADVQADFAVATNMKITGSAGYQNYSIKSNWGSGSAYFIPVLAGAKFNLGEKAYGHAQLGAGFGDGNTAFAYAPSIGYYFSPNLDASLKYLAYSYNSATIGSFGVRLAYNF